jgi:hypothetical protein
VAGPRAGLFAAGLLALCGPWYGAMFNHTKDIPFAAGMMGATWILIRATRDLPYPKWHDVLLFGLFAGAALGMRVTGLILAGYLCFAIVVRIPSDTPARNIPVFAVSALAAFLPGLVLAYLIMLAAWPWAALAPLNPVRALEAFAQFHYHILTVLSGTVYEMSKVPRVYVPIYLAIKIELLIWIGAALAVAFALVPWRAADRPAWPSRREIAILVCAAGLPVLCQVIGHGPAFTGMRHFLFVVPPLAALAGIGIDTGLVRLAGWRPALAPLAGAAAIAAMAWTGARLVELHPYEYLFYNRLVGGLAGASQGYATDYWVNIMPEAVTGLEKFLDRNDPAKPTGQHYTVAVCGERGAFEEQADRRLAFSADWDRADFFIAPTHMRCDTALGGRVIMRIVRLGTVIGLVKDRRAITRPLIAGAR